MIFKLEESIPVIAALWSLLSSIFLHLIFLSTYLITCILESKIFFLCFSDKWKQTCLSYWIVYQLFHLCLSILPVWGIFWGNYHSPLSYLLFLGWPIKCMSPTLKWRWLLRCYLWSLCKMWIGPTTDPFVTIKQSYCLILGDL